MAKLTKKSYRRKRMLMGLALFMSVALISTGFAAWVISSSVDKTVEGNVEAGVISDKSIGLEVKFKDLNNDQKIDEYDNSFKFEPKKEDRSGRVRYEGAPIYATPGDTNSEITGYTSPKFESLEVILEISITDPNGYLDQLKVSMTEKQPQYSFDDDGLNFDKKYLDAKYENSYLKVAEDAGYIVVPDCLRETQDIVEIAKENRTGNPGEYVYKTFDYSVKFQWGDTFGGINPGLFYDGLDADGNKTDAHDGGDVENPTVVDELINLRRNIYGITTPGVLDEEGHYTSEYYKNDVRYLNTPQPTYKIVVEALTN